jgi:DNA-binding beta-propeller fold protein YncE
MNKGLIGNRTGTSGILSPNDNVSLVKDLDDLRKYVYNPRSNTNILGVITITDFYVKPDGTKVYFTSSTTDNIHEYNLSGFDVTPDYYDVTGFSVAGQDALPQDLFFKPDGTKVYVIGSTNKTIYQYSLGTAWDVTTASYESKSFSVNTQETEPRGLSFKDDGTKVYIVGQTNDRIYQYTLSTPWDISSATYDNVSFLVQTQDATPEALFFKPDGTKVYVLGSTGDRVYQYALSSAWDISSASYETKFVASIDATPTGLFFKSDGTILYTIGGTTDAVQQITLNTPWDVSTGVSDVKFLYAGLQELTPSGVFFKDDGTKVYVVGTTQDRIYQYSLDVPWDVSEGDITPSLFTGYLEDVPQALFFNPDGSTVYISGTTSDRIFQIPLRTNWDIKSAVRLRNFSVLAQDTTSTDLFFKPDGTKVYMIGSTSDTIFQYALGTAWDVSTAYYESKSFSIASQELTPSGVFFKDDGTKVYIVGQTNDRIYQYTLSTPWDISTASYDNVSFLVSSQDGTPEALFFKPDGTKVYVLGSTGDRIYQYSLSSAWDISTITYDNVSFLVQNQELIPTGLFFKDDGTKVYILGSTNDTIFQYSLGTPWDISTTSYDSISFSVAGQEIVPTGLSFKDDGTKLYIVGQTSDRIQEYELKTAWDITSAIRSFSVAGQEITPNGVFFKDDGTKVYVLGPANDTIYQYALSTAWDIQSASYESKSCTVGFYDTVPTGLHFRDDGTKIYINGQSSDRVSIITLATPWDVSTAILPYRSFSVVSQENAPTGLFFKDDGTKVYIVGQTNDRIYQYSLGTAWDITTASYDNVSFLVQTQEATPNGLFFKDDGTKVYIVGTTGDTIYQYSLSTPWDISTASYDNVSFLVQTQEATPTDLFFKPDGTKVYITGGTSDFVRQYTLATPWDISTASFDNVSFLVSGQDGTSTGLFFKSDGTEMYMVGTTSNTVFSYTLSIPWDVSSAIYDNKFFQVDDSSTQSVFLKPDGTKLYIIGNTNDRILEYDLETPWVLTQNTNSLSILAQDTLSTGVYVTDDLNKIYVVGSTNRALHQYDLFN